MTRTSVGGWVAGLALAAAGCAGVPKTAMVDGREVPRLTVQLSGNPYQLKHEGAHPRPGGPSSGLRDAGGSIRGRVCGMFVDLEAQQRAITSRSSARSTTAIRCRSASTRRAACATTTATSATSASTSRATPRASAAPSGGARSCSISTGDVYKGFLKTPKARGAHLEPMEVVAGKPALDQLPAVDEAVILPAILTCQTAGGSTRPSARSTSASAAKPKIAPTAPAPSTPTRCK